VHKEFCRISLRKRDHSKDIDVDGNNIKINLQRNKMGKVEVD
jgi:flagellar basal body rod protein FlgB